MFFLYHEYKLYDASMLPLIWTIKRFSSTEQQDFVFITNLMLGLNFKWSANAIMISNNEIQELITLCVEISIGKN